MWPVLLCGACVQRVRARAWEVHLTLISLSPENM
jgi:hypothetical protein